MAGESKKTKGHEIIKKWVEEREGKPAIVSYTKNKDSGGLRINFPGFGGAKTLEKIAWDKFFKIFDENNLVFLYQDETKDGNISRFFKFIREKEKE